jgi:hypothetical protein
MLFKFKIVCGILMRGYKQVANIVDDWLLIKQNHPRAPNKMRTLAAAPHSTPFSRHSRCRFPISAMLFPLKARQSQLPHSYLNRYEACCHSCHFPHHQIIQTIAAHQKSEHSFPI